MPLQKLTFKPGINKEGTNYTNEGGWFDCDKIRFRSGNAEKIGGWTRLSNDFYQGVARALWNWGTLNGANLLGVGTNLKYYIEQGGEYNDVTPIRVTYNNASTPSTGNMFSTTNGSNVVTVTLSNYGGVSNDFVTISGSTAVGGIPASELNAEQQITYVSTSQFTFTTLTPATSTVAAGGGTAIIASFQINTGLEVEIAGTGWGAGTWPSYINTTLTNPFTAASAGVSTLTVTKTAHGLTTGEYVYFSSIASDPCGINRLVLQKAFPITSTGANTFTISTVIGSNTYVTTSTAASGGTVVINTPVAPVRGWGTAASVGIGQQLRLWTNDNFGEDLVLAPRGGEIYYWIPAGKIYPSGASGGLGTRAKLLSDESTAAGYSGQFVPNNTNQIIGSAIQRFVIAFGANPYDPTDANTTFDPLLVRWSDQENPYEWVPQATNQSGEFRLNIGSYIVCAESTRQEILIWSDAAVYSMQYLGPPYVWGFQLLQDNISIMGPNSAITVNNVTYWMGTDKFYRYTGRVETIPSTLRQYVYQDINQDQNFQVFAGSIEGYNEIWWFYCSANSNVIDRYVIYDYLDNVWSYGNMSRTAWLDSGLRTFPMGADTANYRILYHENGNDDVSGLTPVPINAYIQSSDFDIGDGHNFGFVWRILPDLTFNGSNSSAPEVTMTVLPRVNSGTPYGMPDDPRVASTQNYTAQKTYAVQQFTGQVYTRIRGRQMAYRIESTGLGVAWQMGYPRIDIRPDGRR
jgi:hypothetical protein